jgi:hypothetical protein
MIPPPKIYNHTEKLKRDYLQRCALVKTDLSLQDDAHAINLCPAFRGKPQRGGDRDTQPHHSAPSSECNQGSHP